MTPVNAREMFTLDSIPSVMQTVGVQLVKMVLVVTKYHNTTLRANHISPEIILSLVQVHVTTLSHMEFTLPLYQKKKSVPHTRYIRYHILFYMAKLNANSWVTFQLQLL